MATRRIIEGRWTCKSRGGRSGQQSFEHPVTDWDDWPMGRSVAVIVDHQAKFIEYVGQ